MNREEHLKWCKERALEYVEAGDLSQGWASMVSDLRKHEGTVDHVAIPLGIGMVFYGLLGSKKEMEDFINGFN